MFDVITFGSAAWDIFMDLSPRHIKKSEYLVSGRGFVFNMGSKIDVPATHFSFGGGGINTALTFAGQGFKTAYCGMVGDDIPGREAIEYLKQLGVETSFVSKTNKKATNNSVVLNTPGVDRVILVYRGASELMKESDIFWEKLQARLFYLAPLSGKLCRLTEHIIACAKKQNAIVAANLGNSQLKIPKNKLKKILAGINILILNKEEAAIMTGVDYGGEKEIIEKVARMHSGVSVITKGSKGAIITGAGKIYEARLKKFKVVDVTGAGDAFASGFMSGMLASNNDIEYSMKLALLNAKYCLSSRGSNRPLLKESNFLLNQEKIKIKVRDVLQ